MYRVRGADQNVYGPIAAETVRQWIAERRLNRDSQVCREGEEVWQSLGQVAEFADALAGGGATAASPAVPSLPAGGGTYQVSGIQRDVVLAQTKPAAICMIVYGGASLLVSLMSVLGQIMQAAQGGAKKQELPPETPEIFRKLAEMQSSMPPAVQWVSIALSILMSAIVIVGGIKLLNLKSRPLVMTAAILSILTCFTSCCCGLGIGLGIWVLVLISKPDIQDQFE